MPAGGSSHQALVVGSAFMTDLGSLFPAGLKLIGDELEFMFVLPDDRTSDHPFVELKERMRARSDAGSGGPMPRFFIDTGGRWARLRVELTGTAVRALIVMPEEVTARSLNAPFLGRWQEHMPWLVRLAVDEITRMLARCHHQAGGPPPLVDLDLRYLPVPDYASRAAEAHEPVRAFIPPVRPKLGLRWRSVTFAQRRIFIAGLGEVSTTGKWPRHRLVTRVMGVELELPSWVTPW
ncbi:hypothetical protein SAMN05421504_1011372 [Amycolatopsis xylanica]|uniref:Uncharacterized protein n=1 Tax=Amycolatopsis xylanica TaxID=589385 RepID=A0A1H2VZB6_9PSEU|nr:hypothetical protein [Amycolatopsis xylanica]SDW73576.1 hypothetical protein SAMN05421504_1011372 [Amycolatopsis xylanica]